MTRKVPVALLRGLAGIGLLVWLAAPPVWAQGRKGARDAMQDIPLEVREYLTAGDGLGQIAVQEAHPDVKQTLNDPRTRAAILRYLATDEPWQEPPPSFLINALGFLQSGAMATEIPVVRPYLLHSTAVVRLRAYEFLLGVYFRDPARPPLLLTLQAMLMDRDDVVRAQGARYVKRANAVGELKEFLRRWHTLAPSRGWQTTESYELVGQLLGN
jgi:hypothetical protein